MCLLFRWEHRVPDRKECVSELGFQDREKEGVQHGCVFHHAPACHGAECWGNHHQSVPVCSWIRVHLTPKERTTILRSSQELHNTPISPSKIGKRLAMPARASPLWSSCLSS